MRRRFVLCTRRLKGSTLSWWDKCRCQIEGWFKVAKHRFGQGTLLGVYRWLVISLMAFILAHWCYLLQEPPSALDWGKATRNALTLLLFPTVAIARLLRELGRL